MKLKELGKIIIGKGAPLLGSVLGGSVGEGLGSVVASALGLDSDKPDVIAKALETDPEAAIKLKKIETDHIEELQRLAIQKEKNELEAEAANLAEVNATMRAEYQQDDAYVKRWRPTFGYCVCVTWVLQTIGIIVGLLYAIIDSPENAGDIIAAIGTVMSALTIMWSIALSVLGINIRSRSHDKQVNAGQTPTTFLDALKK